MTHSNASNETSVLPQGPKTQDLFEEVCAALTANEPFIPAKLHYDEVGSQLFEQICDTTEYYITRTETAIMEHFGDAIGRAVGAGTAIVEPGSGASTKTEYLIGSVPDCAAYVPIDISDTMLKLAADRVNERFPDIPVVAVHADFTRPMDLPEEAELGDRRLVYFPGSTIGNFTSAQQSTILRSFGRMAGETGKLLIGFDLVKAVATMEAAYNDLAGVTAAFNLNMVKRLRDELDIGIEPDWFEFQATWDEERGAIVSYVSAVRDITVRVGDNDLVFKAGDKIQTEESHKFSIERFSALAASAGLEVEQIWTDHKNLFAVALLQPAD